MQIRELMAPGVYETQNDQQLRRAAQTMKERGTQFLVVRKDGEVVGTVSSQDISDAYATGMTDTTQLLVEDVMHPEVPGIQADVPVDRAIELMSRSRLRNTVVIDRTNQPVGIVSFGDLTARGGTQTGS